MKPIVTLAILAALMAPAAWADDVDFVDVARQHQAAAAIQRVVKAGLVSGYPDHTFRGWKAVSRYELIASTARLLPSESLTAVAGPVLLASDVEATHWAFPALARFHGVGIGQQLWANGALEGDRPATRFDLAYLAAQTCGAWQLGTGLTAGFPPFGDVPDGHWAAPAVRQAAELGLMSGLAPDQFGGDKPIDRFQLAVVLDRVMARLQTGKPSANASDGATVPNGGVVAVEPNATMAPVPPLPAPGTDGTGAKAASRPPQVAAKPNVTPPKPAAAKPAKPKPAKTASATTKPTKPKPATSKPAQPKPATSTKAKPGHGNPGKAKPAKAKPTNVKPAKAKAKAKPVTPKAGRRPTTGRRT